MKYEFTLCEGRHVTPVDKFIFGAADTTDPTRIDSFIEIANSAIPEDCTTLVVYVTGLTVAMLTVVQVCLDRRISLIAKHYNRETGTYFAQLVVSPTIGKELEICDKVRKEVWSIWGEPE